MALMVKAGMWRIDVGVESGSDKIKRQIFNRPVDNEAVLKAANIINKHPRVIAYYFFIIGNPYEQRQDLLQTIDILKKLPSPYFLRTYNLVFIPGTHLFNRACRDGIIKGIEDSGFEIDFISGLDLNGHEWKKCNLYLNSLISLMTGKSTKYRIGFLPKNIIPVLTAPSLVDFCDRHIIIGKSLVGLGKTFIKIRRIGLRLVTNVLKDSKIAYDIKFLLKKRKTDIAEQVVINN